MKRINCSILIAFIAIMLNTFSANAQFTSATTNSRIFPAALNTIALPTKTTGFPSVSGRTFYDERNNGSCYSADYDFDGDMVLDRVNVWSVQHGDYYGYNHAVVYEVNDLTTGALKYRGHQYVDDDITHLEVGLYADNSNLYLICAYWDPTYGGEIHLATYNLTPLAGASLVSNNIIFTPTGTHVEAQVLHLDCHDLNRFAIIWEDEGYNIRLQGYDYRPSAPVYGPSPIALLGSAVSHNPDVALSHNTLSGNLDVHLAFYDGGIPGSIKKYLIDFNDLMNGTGTALSPTLEDVEVLTGSFGPFWDDFSLKLDAPDHYAGGQSNWAYTYFDDDNNKIKVRMCNYAILPNRTTYVVNDGSVPTVSSTYLSDLTIAGNNFPTLAYTNTGSDVYVGWWTTYDPSLSPLSPNNPLYTYSTNSQGYVSVILSDAGVLNSTSYNQIDQNYNNNRIGIWIDPTNPWTNFYHPRLCFSKNNDLNNVLTIFTCHGRENDNIWSYFGSMLFGYLEPYVSGTHAAPTPTPVTSPFFANYLNYGPLGPGTLGNGVTAYMSHKELPWYSSPMFRTAPDEQKLTHTEQYSISNNPFSSNSGAKLSGTDDFVHCTFSSLDGKKLSQVSGNIDAVNKWLSAPAILTAPAGIYMLHIEDEHHKTKDNFKIQKN